MSNRYQLGWFSTGRDEAARDLLAAVLANIRSGEIPADIAFVFSNREPGESAESDRFFALVQEHGLPLATLSSAGFRAGYNGGDWRRDYDRAVMARLEGHHPDLCVLAGYMLIVGGEMCRKYNMLNLHPAAPGGPAGTWQEVIRQLIASGAAESGVMMHLVTPALDQGPPVAYATYAIRGGEFDRCRQGNQGKPAAGEDGPLFRLIRRHGLAREFPLIIATLAAFSRGKIKINPRQELEDAEGRPLKGYNMTTEIDKMIKGKL